jgi:hypothetical protein
MRKKASQKIKRYKIGTILAFGIIVPFLAMAQTFNQSEVVVIGGVTSGPVIYSIQGSYASNSYPSYPNYPSYPSNNSGSNNAAWQTCEAGCPAW